MPFSVVVVQYHLQKWTYHGSHPFPMISKIIHCVVFNKGVHIIPSSPSMSFFRTPSNDRLWLPQAGIKSFNDLCIKSNSFCHLREYFCESPSLRCHVMVSWQLSPCYFETMHPPTSAWNCCLPNLNLYHPLLSITPDVCFVSQLKKCFISHSMSWSWVLDLRGDRFL